MWTLGLALADYDSLTDAEHLAVLDASELLDALRAHGYRFWVDGEVLAVEPPAEPGQKAPAPKDVREQLTTLAGAVVFVLRAEAVATPLPDTCRVCGAPVERFSPGGHPYCQRHYELAARRARRGATG